MEPSTPQPPRFEPPQASPPPHSSPPEAPSQAPGSVVRPKWAPVWLLLVALLLLAVNVVMQRPVTLTSTELEQLESGELVMPPNGGPEVALAKLAIASKGKKISTVNVGDIVLMQFDQYMVQTEFAQDAFRCALFLGRLGNVEAMELRFKRLAEKIAPNSDLHEDMRIARASVAPDESSPEESSSNLKAFTDRHGWFARLALDDGAAGGVYDKAKDDGEKLAKVGVRYLLLQAFICATGLVVLFVFAAMALTGRLRAFPTVWRPMESVVTGPGQRVWLETVGVFLGGFLCIKLIGMMAAVLGAPDQALTWLSLTAPWLLVPLLLWPILRGVRWGEFAHGIGWHRGRGVFREIGTGVAAYAAMLPVLFVVMVIVMIVSALLGLRPPQVADRAFELGSGKGVQLLLTFALVTLWAPLLEEAIFRGALYRFVRCRWHLLTAVLVTATAFAIMHSYAPAQLIAVGTLGVTFALLREWRGSLIASMTGHFLQNALAFTFITQVAPILNG